jgi:hypothetical protein
MSLRRFHIAALAALALGASSAAVAAAGPWALAPGEYYTELQGGFFSSGTYYDNGGTRTPLDGLAEQRALTSYTELGWKKRWSIQMELPALSNTVRQGDSTATSSGFGDISLGLRYSLHNGPSATAIQLGWRAPSGYNNNLKPSLGSGLQRLAASVETGRPIGKDGFFQAGAGFAHDYLVVGSRKKDTDTTASAAEVDWSNHVLVHGAVGWWLGNLLVAGQYEGEIAGAAGVEDTKATSHLFGTRFAYRVDERIDAVAGSWHSPGGKNVLHLDQFYAGVAWKVTKLNRLQGFMGGNKRP